MKFDVRAHYFSVESYFDKILLLKFTEYETMLGNKLSDLYCMMIFYNSTLNIEFLAILQCPNSELQYPTISIFEYFLSISPHELFSSPRMLGL